jgi:hypothetical protein
MKFSFIFNNFFRNLATKRKTTCHLHDGGLSNLTKEQKNKVRTSKATDSYISIYLCAYFVEKQAHAEKKAPAPAMKRYL